MIPARSFDLVEGSVRYSMGRPVFLGLLLPSALAELLASVYRSCINRLLVCLATYICDILIFLWLIVWPYVLFSSGMLAVLLSSGIVDALLSPGILEESTSFLILR